MEKKKTSFVQGAAILGAAGLLVKIIGAFFRIPLANAIGPIGTSYYEVVYPYYSGLLVISSSGLPTAISKMVSERITAGDYRGAHKVFTTAMKLLICVGIVTGALMFFGSSALASLSTLDKAHYSFKVLAPAMLVVSIMCAYRGYLQGMQRMGGTALSQVVEQVGKLAIGLTLAIKMMPMGPEFAAMGALIGVAVSELLALVVIIIIYNRYRPAIRRRIEQSEPYRPAPALRNLILLAVPITLGASISSLSGMVDSALIIRILLKLGYSQDTAQTAYSLLRTNVTTLVNMPGVLTMALAMSLVPAISAAVARRDRENVMNISRLGLKLALIIGLPCAVGLFVLARPILAMLYPVLTEAQLDLAADLMHTASIGVIFLSLVQSMTGVIQGLGKPNVPLFNLFIGFLLKVVSLLIMMNIPSINIQGASVSTVICYAFAGLSDTIYALRRARIQLNVWDVVLKPLLSSLAMGGMVYLCYNFIARMGHETMAVIISVFMGVCVYAVLAVYLKMFSKEELAYIPGGGKLRKLIYGIK
ncbi:MAG: oligosaccharide flippase family protein [Clostridia bacterium]|nr:oligosaccharide flippase family protein [Clostridia bacterium]